jgi:plasmid replication initiation protein
VTNKNKPKITTEICTQTDNWVVMGNSLLKGKSALTSTMAKLLRLTIMQVKIDDNEIGAYHIKAKKLAELLNLDVSNYSRDLQKLCYEIAEKTVKPPTYNPKKPWKVLPWIGYIEYTETAEVIIQLNAWLAPYLIGLKESGQYTQYILEHVLSMNSIFSIRIYELLKMKLPNDNIPSGGINVCLTNLEIRQATESEGMYKRNSDFKKNILEVAKKEISEKTDIKITYEQKKLHGRAYDIVEITCKSLWDTGEEIPLEIQCKNKLLKLNNIRAKQGKQSLGMYKDIVGQNKFNSLEEFDLYLMDYMTQKQ